MSEQPELQTARLTLRPFTVADAPEVKRLCSERDIAATTLLIPHPYPEGLAEEWIGGHEQQFESGKIANYAIALRSDASLIGSIGLTIHPEHDGAEMGYWVGKPYWNQGYASEAAAAVLQYAFAQRGLHRVYAHHFLRNRASGRILEKIGMKYEGRLQGHIKKWGEYVDLELYGMLKEDWAEG